MQVKSLREIVFLLKLYEEKSLTNSRISKIAGLKARQLVYNLRDRMMECEIISENGVAYNGNSFIISYKINHKRLDEFFVREFCTHNLYKRFAKGHIGILPMIKPDEEKLKEWSNV